MWLITFSPFAFPSKYCSFKWFSQRWFSATIFPMSRESFRIPENTPIGKALESDLILKIFDIFWSLSQGSAFLNFFQSGPVPSEALKKIESRPVPIVFKNFNPVPSRKFPKISIPSRSIFLNPVSSRPEFSIPPNPGPNLASQFFLHLFRRS